MTNELWLDVRYNKQQWRHLVNAYEVKTGMVQLSAGKTVMIDT